MAHRFNYAFQASLAAFCILTLAAQPAEASVTNVDVEVGAGSFVATGDDSDFSARRSFSAGVAVAFGNRWDLELGVIDGEGRNKTNVQFGAAEPLVEVEMYTIGARYYLTPKREDPNRGFLMLGYAYADGLPAQNLSVVGSRSGEADMFYFGFGLQWLIGEKWGLVIKSPFFIDSASDSDGNVWVPSISFMWRFD